MSNSEGFLARWSWRKRHDREVSANAGAQTGGPRDSTTDDQGGETFAGFNFDTLDFASDYTRFMGATVPEHAQRQALRRLWTSTDIIAQTDELADYLEDFREEAMALPAEMARSAYRIGLGIIGTDDNHEGEAAKARAHEAVEAEPGSSQVSCRGDNTTQVGSEPKPEAPCEPERDPQDRDERKP